MADQTIYKTHPDEIDALVAAGGKWPTGSRTSPAEHAAHIPMPAATFLTDDDRLILALRAANRTLSGAVHYTIGYLATDHPGLVLELRSALETATEQEAEARS